ncbi:UNVERIFIED_CONTAM: hypothetical protein Sradi_4026400 [Sesamum radiatum]|uniref:Myb/SANT-like domain-containing protein n=1 Tax=Sesamum radiatum TaxID=300843 RepID=A0AAW2PKT5_SESRA
MSRFEDEGSSTHRRCGAGKEKLGTRRTWSVKEEETLVNGLKSLIVSGWKCDNGFRNGYLMQLEGHMMHVFPNSDIRAEPHINSKIHVWKKQYSTLVSMMSKSGFGWDDEKNMITVDENSIWDDYVKVDPSVKTMRYKSFPFFPAWREIFGKDRAAGEGAKDGKATVDAVRREEARETQDYYVPTAEWNPEEGFVSNDGDPVQSSQMNVDPTTNSSTGPKHTEEKSSGLAEALAEIEGLDETDQVVIEQRLYNNPKDMHLFFTMPPHKRARLVRLILEGRF